MIRIVSWNIRQGGGQRASHIIRQLQNWKPDVVGLIEFKSTEPSQKIWQSILEMGLTHIHTTLREFSSDNAGLLLASRFPMTISNHNVFPDLGRWIHAKLTAPRIDLIQFWVPNRNECGKRKSDFHAAAVESLRAVASGRAIAFGDSNTGVPGKDEATKFFNKKEGEWFDRMAEAGWQDVWRKRNPQGREYTWHNPRGDAGFRLDQAFATESTHAHIQSIRHDWGDVRTGKLRGASDHAALILDLEI